MPGSGCPPQMKKVVEAVYRSALKKYGDRKRARNIAYGTAYRTWKKTKKGVWKRVKGTKR